MLRVMLLAVGAAGFLPTQRLPAGRTVTSPAGSRLMMLSPAMTKKAAKVEQVVSVMENAQMMFAVRSEKIPVNKLNDLRQKLPEGVQMQCVKNTLMRRASGTEGLERFAAISEGEHDVTRMSNFWFFVPEDKMRDAVDTWTDFANENKKEGGEIVGGLFGGDLLDEKGVITVSKLPTKQELMQNTAIMLKKMPATLAQRLKAADAQRLARVIKEAQGQKLSRAVKAMEAKLE